MNDRTVDDGKTTCPACLGTGSVIEVVTDAATGRVFHQHSDCPVCSGSSRVDRIPKA